MQRFVKVPAVLMIVAVWALVGLIVALNKGYGDIDSGSEAWTFVLAMVLWPLVLLGADVSIRW